MCQAFSPPPKPYSPETRGMQQQPSIEEHPAVQSAGGTTRPSNTQISKGPPADLDRTIAHPTVLPQQDTFAVIDKVEPDSNEIPYQPVDTKTTAIPNSPPEPQPLLRSSEQKSPRDTPSFESFTQSQEGDDERSEESTSSNQEHPPRASSLYLKGIGGYRQSRSLQTSATIGDNASPKEIQTPRSTTSSNPTPTQATFTDAGQSATPARSPGKTDGTSTQHRQGTGSSPRSFSRSQSGLSTQILSSSRQSQEPEAAPRFSHDSKGTYQTVGSKDGHLVTSLSTLHDSQNQHTAVDPYPDITADRSLPHHSESSQRISSQSSTSSRNGEPVPLMRDMLNPQTSSRDYMWRGPSIDSDQVRVNLDHPPSPLTPRHPTNYSIPEQRGRTGPIHYGIDHDFDRPSDTERSRSRSPSYRRLSQDSRPSLDPNILDHPAFRAVAEGNGMPAQDIGAQLTRKDDITPRLETAEQMLVDGAPTGRRSRSKSRSRRGSRSSAFFKAFTSPSKSEHPPLPNAPDSQASSSPRNSPAIGGGRSKRLSIFRPRSGNMESGGRDSRGKENVAPLDASPQDSFTQVAHQANPTTPRRVEETTPSKGASSKLSKKLQRASTSAKPEQESGKKKRFSAIGVSD